MTAPGPAGSADSIALAALGLVVLASCGVAPPVQVSAGATSTCTVDTSGALSCWGNNQFGQLGIGNFVPFPYPRPVPVASPVGAVSVGNGFACAIAQGGLFCWGRNHLGQLGNGTTTFANTPTPVEGLGADVTAVTAGGDHACAVHQGRVVCWGSNRHAQLGRGPSQPIGEGVFSTTPQRVNLTSGSEWTISAGDQHTCGTRLFNGVRELLCWGSNNQGQAGQPVGILEIHQTLVPSPTGFRPVSVAAGRLHSCGIFVRGGSEFRVFCWGNNENGRLGLGHTSPGGGQYQPTSPVIDNSAVVATGPTSCHTCSLARDGKMHCWGCNESGQLGDGTTTDRHSEILPVGMQTGVLQIEVGGAHTCAWTTAGPHAYCWGKNNDGQLGAADFVDHATPTRVADF
jgi:alpha-tubulin suppressor-like RCC1 family protein